MIARHPVIEHLTTRRSVSARALTEPGPDARQLQTILRAGVRVPDHGKLTPWHLHLVSGEGQSALADIIESAYLADHPDAGEAVVATERLRATQAPLVIVVSTRFQPNDRFPETEQFASSGAVCMNLLHAAHAMGFGAQWVTGWPVYHPDVRSSFGVGPGDHIVGWIHIGTPTMVPTDRVRPDLEAVTTTWRSR